MICAALGPDTCNVSNLDRMIKEACEKVTRDAMIHQVKRARQMGESRMLRVSSFAQDGLYERVTV